MFVGSHTLEAVLEQARKQGELEPFFHVPVLLLVDAESDEQIEPVTASGKRPVDDAPAASGITSHVVAIAPKFGNATKLSFGRSDVCDVVMPFAAVSKHHGFFEKIDGGWTVHDAGSTNNTVVNGKFARDHALLLSDGATVMFGPLMARFLMGPSFITVLKQRLAMKL